MFTVGYEAYNLDNFVNETSNARTSNMIIQINDNSIVFQFRQLKRTDDNSIASSTQEGRGGKFF